MFDCILIYDSNNTTGKIEAFGQYLYEAMHKMDYIHNKTNIIYVKNNTDSIGANNKIRVPLVINDNASRGKTLILYNCEYEDSSMLKMVNSVKNDKDVYIIFYCYKEFVGCDSVFDSMLDDMLKAKMDCVINDYVMSAVLSQHVCMARSILDIIPNMNKKKAFNKIDKFEGAEKLLFEVIALLLGNEHTNKQIKQVIDCKDTNEIVVETEDNRKFTIKVTED